MLLRGRRVASLWQCSNLLTGHHRNVAGAQQSDCPSRLQFCTQQQPSGENYALKQAYARKLVQHKVQGTPSQGFSYEKTISNLDRAAGGNDGEGFMQRWTRKTGRVLSGVLLPAGYPHTVGKGYIDYVAWQLVSNFAIAANNVLSSTFLLYAVGLGAGAIPTAGALNWVLKDGFGQLGTLIFGKQIAHNFDIHSKSWYFISNIMLKVATGLEISTVLLPQWFLVMGGAANTIKGLAWMANSSTRSVFNLSFAKDNNIADITAKGTSQYICASMFGTVAGASLCTWIGQDTGAAAAAYTALSAITIASAYVTVKTIPLATLNNTRLQLLCESFLCALSAAARSQAHLRSRSVWAPQAAGTNAQHVQDHDLTGAQSGIGGWMDEVGPPIPTTAAGGPESSHAGTGSGGAYESDWTAAEYERVYDEFLNPTLPGPAALAAEDPPLPFLMGDQRLLNPAVIVGEDMDVMLQDTGPELVVLLVSTYRLSRALVLPRGPAVHILLHKDASPRDICQAYLQACLLRRRMRAGSRVGLAPQMHVAEVDQAKRDAEAREALIAAAEATASVGDEEDVGAMDDGDDTVLPGYTVPSSSSTHASTHHSHHHHHHHHGDSPTSHSHTHHDGHHHHQQQQQVQPHDTSNAEEADQTTVKRNTIIGYEEDINVIEEDLEYEDENKRYLPTPDQDMGGEILLHDGDLCTVKGSSSKALTELRIVLQDTLQAAERMTSPFMRSMEAAGWRLEKIVVEADRRRAEW